MSESPKSHSSAPVAADPAREKTASQLGEIGVQYGRIMQQLATIKPDRGMLDVSINAHRLFTEALLENMTDPKRIFEAQSDAFMQFSNLWADNWSRLIGQNSTDDADTSIKDSRFKSDAWNENPWFHTLAQSYLFGVEYFQKILSPPESMNRDDARRLEFYRDQLLDSWAPSNFAIFNPDVIEQAVQTNGDSVLRGLKNFADDLESGRGVQMVEENAFELGRDIAVTPGKVIARNHLAELIQYEPVHPKTYSVPIMIIPPWINKYYILDLRPDNSYIRWAVEQGLTVFVISWVNPDESYRDTTYDDYLSLGPLWAIDEIKKVVRSKTLNVIGYCLGGTLLATLLAYLSQTGDKSVRSATFFTSMIDFSEPGGLGVFIDEQSVSQLEELMDQKGYLDGSMMASTFSSMRANDLVWHFVINNYLKGESPGKFDLLYWNSDSTRMPAKMHSSYLRNMYMDNLLCKPNGLTVLDTPIDLSKVDTPCYFLSTHLDHIAPWKSTYMGARLFSGDVNFTLAESGHIAGVVNPPAKKKYGYWKSDIRLPESADEWLAQAEHHTGSWWGDWAKWVRKFSGRKIDAVMPADNGFGDAPGTYVRMKV